MLNSVLEATSLENDNEVVFVMATWSMVRLYIGKQQLYFALYGCALLKKINAATETYRNFTLGFAQYNTASTHAICFQCHCSVGEQVLAISRPLKNSKAKWNRQTLGELEYKQVLIVMGYWMVPVFCVIHRTHYLCVWCVSACIWQNVEPHHAPTTEAAYHPANSVKNRYANITACEYSGAWSCVMCRVVMIEP